MKSKYVINKSIDYLIERLNSNKIIVYSNDRQAFNNIIEYLNELEERRSEETFFLNRVLSWAFVQIFELKKDNLKVFNWQVVKLFVLSKLIEILTTPSSRWKQSFIVDVFSESLIKNKKEIETEKIEQSFNNTIKDLIRYNTNEYEIQSNKD
tara:strand:+ start:3255 stop:3710 length:456 start_codon:yes stop_codon:yes gene_type:complete